MIHDYLFLCGWIPAKRRQGLLLGSANRAADNTFYLLIARLEPRHCI